MSKAMMLNEEETPYIDLLHVGSSFVKLKGRYYQPVLVKFPKIDINKGYMTDEMVKNHMKQYIGFLLRV